MSALRNPFLVAIAVVLAVRAAAQPAPARDHDVTVEDYRTVSIIDTCAFSPDGRLLAYAERRWEGDERNVDLWVAPTEEGQGPPRRLTFDPAADTAPQWSPDGARLFFSSGRQRGGEDAPPYDGETQVWRIDADGRNLQPVTRVKGGVGDFQLSRDGASVYYSAHRDEDDPEWKELRGKHAEAVHFGHGKRRVSELWKLDLNTWRAERLIDEKRYVRAFTVAPNGRRIAMHSTPDDRLITNEGWSTVDVYDTQSRQVSRVPDALWRETPSPYGWLEELAWSNDSGSLAILVAWDGYPTEVYVAEWAEAEVRARKLQRPDGPYIAGGLAWSHDGADLYFLADDQARKRVYCAPSVRNGGQGQVYAVTEGDVAIHAFSLARAPVRGRKNTLAAVLGRADHERDLFLACNDPQSRQAYTRLSDTNPQIATWKLPQMQVVQWKAPDGATVEGVLELPFGYKPEDGPLPLVVDVHGGPTAAALLQFQFWGYGKTILPANGYALLSPNYRGSTGYGDKFLLDLVGRENDIDVLDILAGVDALVERGVADPQRLAVAGWSNGGFLTNCLITRTDRFKAASSGAGVVDQLMQWGTEDTPGHVINYMQGLPWARREGFVRASPAWSLDKIVTPTLIHVGENDERVPAAQARLLYRALREYLGVPTQLLVYPGAGHGLSKASQRIAKMEWDLAWFNRHVLEGSSHTPPPAEPRPIGS